MEALMAGFQHLGLRSHHTWYNNTNYELYCACDEWDRSVVYTNEFIPKGEFIGMLEGEVVPSRSLAITSKYMIWLSDYEIMDCRGTPRCILSMVREGFYEGIESNCKIGVSYSSCEVSAYVYALRDIQVGEELFMDREFY